jgi:drug/metabolite transporter (DMT)-like permease
MSLIPVTTLAWGLTLSTGRGGDLNPRRAQFIGWKIVLWLALSGAASYFVGNNAYQLALRFGGINLTVPVAQSASLWGGIVLGAAFLGERFSRKVVWGGSAVVAGLLLITSGGVTPLGLEWYLAMPLAAAAGLGYAASNLLMRFAFQRGAAQFPALAVNAISGLTLLLIAAVLRDGFNFLTGTPPQTLWALLGAGVFNAGALLSLSRALTLTTAGRVNAINVGSIVISTLAAVVIFREPLTPSIASGIALIVGGILLVQRYLAAPHPETIPQPGAVVRTR